MAAEAQISAGPAPFAARMERLRSAMAGLGLSATLCSAGPELPWLAGYEAMPLERLTMLVVPADRPAALVVPRLEAPRVRERPELFQLRVWEEWEDPLSIVASLISGARRVAISERCWSGFLLGLQALAPSARFVGANVVLGPLRAVKDRHEIGALAAAAAQADQVARALVAGEIPIAGRREAEVAAQLSRMLVEVGHDRVNFAIVAAGANAASPHHHPGQYRIGEGDAVVCDFGGAVLADSVPYCSDTTRTVALGAPSPRLAEVHGIVEAARRAAVAEARVGASCAAVDRAARRVIEAAGYGEHFLHRCGHGIGVEEHEDPYIAQGNDQALVAGNVFSVEPGIYLPGHLGVRIEDIVALGPGGAEVLNSSPRELAVL